MFPRQYVNRRSHALWEYTGKPMVVSPTYNAHKAIICTAISLQCFLFLVIYIYMAALALLSVQQSATCSTLYAAEKHL